MERELIIDYLHQVAKQHPSDAGGLMIAAAEIRAGFHMDMKYVRDNVGALSEGPTQRGE